MSSRTQHRSAPLPLVAIVGRPNVGKSSLFNRLTGQCRAIVTDEPGITRDRLHGVGTWLGKSFEVLDTGGLVPDERATIAQEILRQARVAIDAAAVLVAEPAGLRTLPPLIAALSALLVEQTPGRAKRTKRSAEGHPRPQRGVMCSPAASAPRRPSTSETRAKAAGSAGTT